MVRLTIRRGPNKGKAIAKVSESRRSELDRLGRERASIYKAYLLTGLRKSELASLTVGQLELDGPMPFAVLDVSTTRADAEPTSRCGRTWLPSCGNGSIPALLDMQSTARAERRAIPDELAARFDRVQRARRLAADSRPRLEACRHSEERRPRPHRGHPRLAAHVRNALEQSRRCCPRVAQAAMRHSSIDLTMNVYTDPRLLDVHGAFDSLPALSLDGSTNDTQPEAKATGTDNATARQFAPGFAPKSGNWCKPLSIVGNSDDGTAANKNEETPRNKPFHGVLGSGPDEIRTHDLCIANAALSQLSYRPFRIEILSNRREFS